MKNVVAASLFALAAAGIAVPALADDRPGRDWMSVEQISTHLSGLGYSTIREIEADDGVYEVEARDSNGRSVDLKVHPKTGEVLHSELDD